MKILIASDSHGNNEALKKLITMYPDCDYYLHAGDSESFPDDIYPFISVRGNRDNFNYQEHLKLPIEDGFLWIQHYPYSNLNDKEYMDVKLFIHGHTHIRSYIKNNKNVIVNPGAISYSKDAHTLSYALVITDKNEIKVDFYSLESLV